MLGLFPPDPDPDPVGTAEPEEEEVNKTLMLGRVGVWPCW